MYGKGEKMIENKKYFIDQINSSKAYQFTSYYHYSGEGFKKATLNLGIFRKTDNKLVGVMQWGCSFQEAINLKRYVKEPIKKEEYLELNRFCMAEEEGRNSESQAISLGLKWIKIYRPEIRLLVSYAGRKEDHYGYIYQATNWEYLGYFISDGFWYVNGAEKHKITLWYYHNKYGNPALPFVEDLCSMYEDVRQTWSKQFIYVQRLDKKLTLASPVLSYPKPEKDYPIITKENIFKQNDNIFNSYQKKEKELKDFYYEKEKYLFSRRALLRRGEIEKRKTNIARYNEAGGLEATYSSLKDAVTSVYLIHGIRKSLKENKKYKDKYFRYFDETPEEEIDVPFVCIIDNITFYTFSDVAKYLDVSRQCVQQSYKRKGKKIKNKEIIWND